VKADRQWAGTPLAEQAPVLFETRAESGT